MKRFWKKTEGFTLVELIVVVAILGILAGVGTVGYSGYIAKANKAADEVLLRNLNTAFAAACVENGEDNTEVSASDITIGDDKTVAKADIVISDPSAKESEIQDAFDKYYEGGEFKVVTALAFENGVFVIEEYVSFSYKTYNLKISSRDLAALTTDNQFKAMGASGLLSSMDTLTGVMESWKTDTGSDYFEKLLQNPDFLAEAGAYLGMDPLADYDGASYEEAVRYTLTDQGSQYEAMMIYAAKNASNLTDTQIQDMLKADNIYEAMKQGDSATITGQAAVTYGMFAAYCQKNGLEQVNFANVVQSDEFMLYVNSKEAAKDQAAFLAAMNIIGGNAGNSELTQDILSDGIENGELEGFLDSVLGS